MPLYEAMCAAVAAFYAIDEPKDFGDYGRQYDAMRAAVVAAYAVDEVKDIRDAVRVARNTAPVCQLVDIYLRAERRVIQMYSPPPSLRR